MKRILLVFILLSQVSCSYDRNVAIEEKQVEPQHIKKYVGDKIEGTVGQSEYIQVNPISPPFVEFREKSFTLKVSRNGLMNSINSLRAELGENTDEGFRKVLNASDSYLRSESELRFYNIWRSGEYDDTTWEDALKVSDKWATAKLVRELLCGMLERGDVQLIENGTVQEGYYIVTGIQTNYHYSKGVVTKSNQLIWLCPPYIAI